MIVKKKLREYGFNTDHRTYIIAEIGINHGGSVDQAKRLIDSAARTGCDSVKFQTYITEKRVPPGNSSLFEILKKCELSFHYFEELKEHANGLGLHFFSTPFDSESVDYLETINVDIYKIASFDVVNQELLASIANTGKTIIMSVGMADLNEIKMAYNILIKQTKYIAILHCISAYPTDDKDANLTAIHVLKQNFDCVIGQSDHTNGILVPLYAIACGAQIIEKHYRISDDMECIDSPVSINEKQMKNLVDKTRNLEEILGTGKLETSLVEKDTKVFRRNSYLSQL